MNSATVAGMAKDQRQTSRTPGLSEILVKLLQGLAGRPDGLRVEQPGERQAAWRIELGELDRPIAYGTGSEDERRGAWDAAELLFKAATDLKLVEVKRSFEDGRLAVSIGPGGKVGFVTCQHDGVEVHVSVRPKLPRTDWLRLLCLSLDFRLVDRAAWVAPPGDSPEDLLVSAYLAALHALFGKQAGEKSSQGATGLRLRHERRPERLFARMRGRPLIAEYLRELSRWRPLDVPCVFEKHLLDNLPNRVLRWALHLCRLIAERGRWPGSGRLEEMHEKLRQVEARFAGVSLQTVTVEEAREVRLPQSFGHYNTSGALPLARLIIRSIHFESTSGPYPSVGLAIDMAKVFERAFASALENANHGVAGMEVYRQKEYKLAMIRGDQEPRYIKYRPDVIVSDPTGLEDLLFDTKWKALVCADATDEDNWLSSLLTPDEPATGQGRLKIQLKTADLFQIVSYAFFLREEARAQHSAVTNFLGVLVYPTTDGDIELFEIMLPDGTEGIRILVVSWPVGFENWCGVEEVLKKLRQIVVG